MLKQKQKEQKNKNSIKIKPKITLSGQMGVHLFDQIDEIR